MLQGCYKVPTRLERVFQESAGRKKIEFSTSESCVLTSYTMEPSSAPEAYRSPDPTLTKRVLYRLSYWSVYYYHVIIL